MHAAYNMARAVVLVLACVSHGVVPWLARSAAPAIAATLLFACGPVGTPATTEPPVETTARRAVVAALRAALAEACRAAIPPLDAHPVARVAWGMVCQPDSLPPVPAHAAR